MEEEQQEIRTCIICGEKFVDYNSGLADHSECPDCYESDLAEKGLDDEEDD